MGEETLDAAEETVESSSAESEYYEEDVEFEAKEINPIEIAVFLDKSELWDKVVRGEVSIDEAKKMFAELSGRIPSVKPSRRRRRR